MRSCLLFAWYILFATLYGLFSTMVFVLLQVLAIVLPLIIGLAIYYSVDRAFGPESSSYRTYFTVGPALGGLLVSGLTLLNTFRALVVGLSTNLPENCTEHPAVIELVTEVTNTVGVSSFRKIYLTTFPKIATFYTTRGRYLILSVLALRYLTRKELQTVIAHECAHHHHGAMLPNRVHYRTTILFQGFLDAFQHVESSILTKQRQETGGWAIIYMTSDFVYRVNIIFIYIFSLYLELMAFLVRDSDYEFYCDYVAMNLYGGNILASSLEKLLDLNIAHNEILERKNEGELLDYLGKFDRFFHELQETNPPIRTKCASIKTGTHPSLKARIERALNEAIPVEDLSFPVLTDSEFEEIFRLLIFKIKGAVFSN